MGLLDLLPTPAKLYVDSVLLGNKGPVTENDFSEEELAALRKMIGTQAAGSVNYGNYASGDQPGMAGLLSPAGRIANSLGQFNYKADPEGITVTDQYDFNPIYGNESALMQLLSALGTGGFSALHTYGESKLPPGKGRPVSIRLPTRLPNE